MVVTWMIMQLCLECQFMRWKHNWLDLILNCLLQPRCTQNHLLRVFFGEWRGWNNETMVWSPMLHLDSGTEEFFQFPGAFWRLFLWHFNLHTVESGRNDRKEREREWHDKLKGKFRSHNITSFQDAPDTLQLTRSEKSYEHSLCKL